MFVVIRAGGTGTRLWPISRNSKPKQLHALVGNKTMLQDAIEHVLDVVPKERIMVSCNTLTEDVVRKELAAELQSNLIVEPALRDTAAAVGLETIMIAKRDPQAVIASLGSDHVITNVPEFQRVLKLAEQTVNEHPDHILCIGISPKQPDTGYGYIEMGSALSPEVFKVKSFKEKPDHATAQQFVKAGNFLWNANMFVWRADTLLKMYEQYMPEMFKVLTEIANDPAKLATLYPELEKVAIDYAIIEKTDKILAIPGTFGWNDIGDWARLKDELADSEVANVSKGDHIDLNSKNTLVFSETKRLVATIGTTDLVIIDTPDALLVCDKSSSQQVKELVAELKKRQRHDVL